MYYIERGFGPSPGSGLGTGMNIGLAPAYKALWGGKQHMET